MTAPAKTVAAYSTLWRQIGELESALEWLMDEVAALPAESSTDGVRAALAYAMTVGCDCDP